MNYLVPKEEPTTDMDLRPLPENAFDEDTQKDFVNHQLLPVGDQLTETQAAVRKALIARRSRLAQQKFRDRQKEHKQQQKEKIEVQDQELEKEKKIRMSLEQQLQQTKAENGQLKLRVDRSENYCMVLQDSVKALQTSIESLQKSLDLLRRNTNGSRHDSNRPSAGHEPLSPATSQSGYKSHLASRPLSQLPSHLSKQFSLHAMAVL